MGLTMKTETRIFATITNPLDLSTPTNEIDMRYTNQFDNGTGDGQANAIFSDTRPLTASQTESLDLAGSLTGPLGGTLTFTKIKEIIFTAPKTNTGDIRVGKTITNAFVGPFGASATGVLLPPGGVVHLRAPLAGWTVTAATGDLLQVENLVAAAASYDVFIVGLA